MLSSLSNTARVSSAVPQSDGGMRFAPTSPMVGGHAVTVGGGDCSTPTQSNAFDRFAGGIFVGREQAMSALQTALEHAISGRPRLVLVVGEPGIGKTRTAAELAN